MPGDLPPTEPRRRKAMLTRKNRAGLIVTVLAIGVVLSSQAMADMTKREANKVSADGSLDTTNLKKDIVSFIFAGKGLMGDASFAGSRFKKVDVK
jgi:hypothetical protein